MNPRIRGSAGITGLGLALLLSAVAGCGPGPTPALSGDEDRHPLQAWVTVTQDADGRTRPSVRVTVPYSSLVFQRDDDGFRSIVEVMAVARRGRDQVGGGVAIGEARAESFPASQARTPLAVTVPLTYRGEDPITLDVTARVRDSARAWHRRLAYSPRALAAMPIWISRVTVDLPPAARGGYLVDAAIDTVHLAATLRRLREAPPWPLGGLDLVAEISGAATNAPRRRAITVPPRAATADSSRVSLAWPVDHLPFGRCRLQILLVAGQADQQWHWPHEPALELVNLQPLLSHDRDWRHHVNWLDGWLPAAARDSLRALPVGERAGAWAALWRRVAAETGRTPAAAEHEHLWRIVTADDRFGGFGRGALSDRGRVLIRYGEPARVEVFADERAPGAMFEIWSHPPVGLRFVFYDAHGLGDFRLQQIQSLAG